MTSSACNSCEATDRFFLGPASHHLLSHPISAPSLCQACRPGDLGVWCIWTPGYFLASRTQRPYLLCGNCLIPWQAEWRCIESAERTSLFHGFRTQDCLLEQAGRWSCDWFRHHSYIPLMKSDPSTFLLRPSQTSGNSLSIAVSALLLVGYLDNLLPRDRQKVREICFEKSFAYRSSLHYWRWLLYHHLQTLIWTLLPEVVFNGWRFCCHRALLWGFLAKDSYCICCLIIIMLLAHT